MSKFKPWLYLATIFVVGAVTGSALTIGLASHFMKPPGAQQMKQHWMMFLTKQLNLTPDQQAKIQPILTDAESKIQALHRDEMERGSQIIKTANDQIAAILTPDQKAQLAKLEAEREKMFSGHMHPWGHGGMHPHGGMMSHHDGPDDDGAKPGSQTNAPPSPPPGH